MFKIEVSVQTIFEQETVEDLGRRVEELSKRPPQGKPLALRPKDRGAPLFCIHPSRGMRRPYSFLLQQLPMDRVCLGGAWSL